jgi:hypothetical protein
MNKPEKEAKQMFLTVYGIYINPDNGYATLRPGFLESMNLLHGVIQNITIAETAAGQPIEGDTTDKANKFEIMCRGIFKVASGATAYYSATATANPGLREKVDFSLSFLRNMPYGEAEAITQGILDVVEPVKDNLNPYGVAPEDVETAKTKRQNFLAVQKVPQINIDERKVQNAIIVPLVKEGKRILWEMADPIANTLYDDHFDLYELWYNAREIVDYPHGTTIVEGRVFKSDGVTPLYNAKVEFVAQKITMFTKIDGSYYAPKFPHGVAEPTITYDTVTLKSSPFEVKLGKTVMKNFTLAV